MSAAAPRRADARFLFAHPAHLLALGFGSGLSPRAPGTVGTLWAWLTFHVINLAVSASGWGWLLAIGSLLGWWACTVTARHLAVADPGSIVCDEVLAFWCVLWLFGPHGAWAEVLAFALFRYFDAAKPGPVGWADRAFKLRPGEAIGPRQGFGILFDDAVAALLTLVVLALLARFGVVP